VTAFRQPEDGATLLALVERVYAATQAFDELHDPADALAPIPLSMIFGTEPEAVWGR
jgi:hypothetical protein